MVTVEDVMRECRNHFLHGAIGGTFTISGGKLSPLDGITPRQYIAIRGSAFSDGVYVCDATGRLTNGDDDLSLPNETFSGAVYLLAPPQRFIALVSAIDEYDGKNAIGGMQSESFGEYSYTKASGRNGGTMTWQEAFAVSLRPYRRLLNDLEV